MSRQPWWALLALVLLSGCTTSAGPTGQPSTTSTAATAVTTSTTVAAPAPRTENWFDLDVGDCLLQPPPEDPNVIEVPVVDCATAHRAEVFLRAPLAVNTALADVADRACGAGFTTYTGQQVSSSPFAVSYLIDSNQNRTSSNPLPSAVICLLTAADGTPLTGTARR